MCTKAGGDIHLMRGKAQIKSFFPIELSQIKNFLIIVFLGTVIRPRFVQAGTATCHMRIIGAIRPMDTARQFEILAVNTQGQAICPRIFIGILIAVKNTRAIFRMAFIKKLTPSVPHATRLIAGIIYQTVQRIISQRDTEITFVRLIFIQRLATGSAVADILFRVIRPLRHITDIVTLLRMFQHPADIMVRRQAVTTFPEERVTLVVHRIRADAVRTRIIFGRGGTCRIRHFSSLCLLFGRPIRIVLRGTHPIRLGLGMTTTRIT